MMKILNNVSNSLKFCALPIYYKGETLNREEIMAREAEYSKIIKTIAASDIKDTFELAVQEVSDAVSEETKENTETDTLIPSVEDAEALREMAQLLIQVQNENYKPEAAPSSYRSAYGAEKHMLDIKA